MLQGLADWMKPGRSRGRPLVVFVHIPKTGGTSMRQYMRDAFSERLLLTGKAPRKKGDMAAAKSKELAVRPELARDVDAVSGHARYGMFDLSGIDRDIIYVSIMRDPISRALSMYNYQRTNERHVRNASVKDKTLLELIGETDYLQRIGDQQTRFLFGSKTPNPRKVLGRERYLIGKLEKLDSFLEAASDLFPADRPDFPQLNARAPSYKDEIRAQPGFDEAIAIVRKTIAGDLAFYESFDAVLTSPPLQRWRQTRGAVEHAQA